MALGLKGTELLRKIEAGKWTEGNDKLLHSLVHKGMSFDRTSRKLPGRTPNECQSRQIINYRHGPDKPSKWTAFEDNLIVQQYGAGSSWDEIHH
ncbi:hypothetical protein MMC28_003152 [Mycoblastus sanguinarius]|nr:hypothetical protein [Mycoblastus sanguinarius]